MKKNKKSSFFALFLISFSTLLHCSTPDTVRAVKKTQKKNKKSNRIAKKRRISKPSSRRSSRPKKSVKKKKPNRSSSESSASQVRSEVAPQANEHELKLIKQAEAEKKIKEADTAAAAAAEAKRKNKEAAAETERKKKEAAAAERKKKEAAAAETERKKKEAAAAERKNKKADTAAAAEKEIEAFVEEAREEFRAFVKGVEEACQVIPYLSDDASAIVPDDPSFLSQSDTYKIGERLQAIDQQLDHQGAITFKSNAAIDKFKDNITKIYRNFQGHDLTQFNNNAFQVLNQALWGSITNLTYSLWLQWLGGDPSQPENQKITLRAYPGFVGLVSGFTSYRILFLTPQWLSSEMFDRNCHMQEYATGDHYETLLTNAQELYVDFKVLNELLNQAVEEKKDLSEWSQRFTPAGHCVGTIAAHMEKQIRNRFRRRERTYSKILGDNINELRSENSDIWLIEKEKGAFNGSITFNGSIMKLLIVYNLFKTLGSKLEDLNLLKELDSDSFFQDFIYEDAPNTESSTQQSKDFLNLMNFLECGGLNPPEILNFWTKMKKLTKRESLEKMMGEFFDDKVLNPNKPEAKYRQKDGGWSYSGENTFQFPYDDTYATQPQIDKCFQTFVEPWIKEGNKNSTKQESFKAMVDVNLKAAEKAMAGEEE